MKTREGVLAGLKNARRGVVSGERRTKSIRVNVACLDDAIAFLEASPPKVEAMPAPPGYQGELHIYSSEEWHGEAFVVGTEPALLALHRAVDKAIRDGRGAMMSFTSDGEGFAAVVIRATPEEMLGLLLPYVGEVARDCSRDPALKHPWALLKPGEYRTLLEEAGHEPFERPPGERRGSK